MLMQVDLLENYVAFLLSIENEYTVEKAFKTLDELMDNKKDLNDKNGLKRKTYRKSTEKELEEMLKMYEKGYTHRQIGERFGLEKENTRARLNKYKRSKKLC